jgi:hypothetical protein
MPEETNGLHELSITIGIELVMAFCLLHVESEYKVSESNFVILLGLVALHGPLELVHGLHVFAVGDQYIQFAWHAVSVHTAILRGCAWIRQRLANANSMFI